MFHVPDLRNLAGPLSAGPRALGRGLPDRTARHGRDAVVRLVAAQGRGRPAGPDRGPQGLVCGAWAALWSGSSGAVLPADPRRDGGGGPVGAGAGTAVRCGCVGPGRRGWRLVGPDATTGVRRQTGRGLRRGAAPEPGRAERGATPLADSDDGERPRSPGPEGARAVPSERRTRAWPGRATRRVDAGAG